MAGPCGISIDCRDKLVRDCFTVTVSRSIATCAAAAASLKQTLVARAGGARPYTTTTTADDEPAVGEREWASEARPFLVDDLETSESAPIDILRAACLLLFVYLFRACGGLALFTRQLVLQWLVQSCPLAFVRSVLFEPSPTCLSLAPQARSKKASHPSCP